jgi:hypothetical protein
VFKTLAPSNEMETTGDWAAAIPTVAAATMNLGNRFEPGVRIMYSVQLPVVPRIASA